jgi:hypothetical protein
MKKLSQAQLIELKEALSYMNVSELKTLLGKIQLCIKGFNKKELIDRLVYYAETGKELLPLTIPSISKAKRGKSYPLNSNTLMLHGSYKNDLKTRQFLKQLIGNHFHFTAWGIDWLRERWLKGNPPTYDQFAKEWKAEYRRNKKERRLPKQEWAYIRFVQEYLRTYPDTSKREINIAWKAKRQDCIRFVRVVFEQWTLPSNIKLDCC